MKTAAKLECLDGLRGIAVLAVILFHHRLECESHRRSLLYSVLAPSRFGHVGVHLFLVLSGFCLTYSLIRREQSGRYPTLRRFLADRWWRIAPPYYVAIALYLVANAVQVAAGFPSLRGEPNTLRQVAMHLGFLHGLREDTIEAINSPFWSLSLEFQFYATLPLLFAMAGRFGYGRVIAAVSVASFAWRAAVLYVVPGHAFLVNGFFLGRWTEFALGMGVAAWYAGPGRSEVANGPGWSSACRPAGRSFSRPRRSRGPEGRSSRPIPRSEPDSPSSWERRSSRPRAAAGSVA